MKYNRLLFKEGAELCHNNMCQENKYFSILNNINLRFHSFLVEQNLWGGSFFLLQLCCRILQYWWHYYKYWSTSDKKSMEILQFDDNIKILTSAWKLWPQNIDQLSLVTFCRRSSSTQSAAQPHGGPVLHLASPLPTSTGVTATFAHIFPSISDVSYLSRKLCHFWNDVNKILKIRLELS